MNVAIVGYGKMGKQIESILRGKKINVGAVIDKFMPGADFEEVSADSLKNIDVVTDFSSPDTIMNNIKLYAECGVNAVIGTTGWYDRLDEVKNLVNGKIGLIWSGNFSLGVNIFFRLVKNAASIFNKFKDYDPAVYEIHHNKKKDSPSGTAKMIAGIMLEELDSKNNTIEDKLDREINPDEMHVASIRCGSVPGTHVVLFDSPADTIELKHTVRTREGLAAGAVMAAEWIKNKKGLFSIDDMMDSII